MPRAEHTGATWAERRGGGRTRKIGELPPVSLRTQSNGVGDRRRLWSRGLCLQRCTWSVPGGESCTVLRGEVRRRIGQAETSPSRSGPPYSGLRYRRVRNGCASSECRRAPKRCPICSAFVARGQYRTAHSTAVGS
eukprot:768793-Rhodomonas_salina.1